MCNVCFLFATANDELLRAFSKSKEGNTRVIKASIEKGNLTKEIRASFRV